MTSKSVKINSLLNTIKTLVALAFPVITYPYALHVLGVDNIGKYGFSKSIVNYFVLLAGLGIARYATREGARLRDDKKELERFACQMLSINIISTILSYAILFFLVFNSNKLGDYKEIILIQSITILLTTLGMDWIYACMEEYLFITIRSIVVQSLSIIALFIFVRNDNDLIAYTWILTISSCGTFLINFFLIVRRFRIRISFKGTAEHLGPIFLLFASSISSMVYVNSDSTMIGIFLNDHTVGIYEAATRIYSVLQQMVSASILVTLPRLSNYLANGRNDDYKKLLSETFCYVNTIIFPVSIGVFCTSNDIIHLVAGESYADSVNALRILSISLFISMYGIFLTNALLLPMKKEATVTVAMAAAAIINVLLNFIMIPALHQDGAAITTVLAELVVLVIQLYAIKTNWKLIEINKKELIGIVVGTLIIALICLLSNAFFDIMLPRLLFAVVVSIILYSGIQIAFQNRLMVLAIDYLKNKVKSK